MKIMIQIPTTTPPFLFDTNTRNGNMKDDEGAIMKYTEYLTTSADKFNSIVCLGLDPVLDKIPIEEKDVHKKILIFFTALLNEMIKTKTFPGAVKPNYAFYAQYGFEGLHALKEIIDLFKKESIPVILDSKRGDIGTTSEAYAKETFDFFNADAVTLSPYMGFNTVEPFITHYPGKGYYILCRTSNKSARDFQDLIIEENPLYLKVAEKICEWDTNGIGAVIGATYPEELDKIITLFNNKSKSIPILLPGIGTQGGDLSAIIPVLKRTGNIKEHRINSSSGILYAYKKHVSLSFEKAAIKELNILNEEIESHL